MTQEPPRLIEVMVALNKYELEEMLFYYRQRVGTQATVQKLEKAHEYFKHSARKPS